MVVGNAVVGSGVVGAAVVGVDVEGFTVGSCSPETSLYSKQSEAPWALMSSGYPSDLALGST